MIYPERVESNLKLNISVTMAQSLGKILIHTVFSTKDRRPFLRDESLNIELHRYLGGILNKLESQPIVIGGVEDHVHLLFILPRTEAVADIIREVKRGSSLWLKDKVPDFSWQAGYGVFSIGFSQIKTVINYISRQKEHHQKISFQDEYRELLKRYDVEFDERYVWD